MAGRGSAGNVIAGIASFFVPGLGQLVQGRAGGCLGFGLLSIVGGGIALALMGWLALPFVLLIGILAALDAANWDPASQRQAEDRDLARVRANIAAAEQRAMVEKQARMAAEAVRRADEGLDPAPRPGKSREWLWVIPVLIMAVGGIVADLLPDRKLETTPPTPWRADGDRLEPPDDVAGGVFTGQAARVYDFEFRSGAKFFWSDPVQLMEAALATADHEDCGTAWVLPGMEAALAAGEPEPEGRHFAVRYFVVDDRVLRVISERGHGGEAVKAIDVYRDGAKLAKGAVCETVKASSTVKEFERRRQGMLR